jgi:hypothetical protein
MILRKVLKAPLLVLMPPKLEHGAEQTGPTNPADDSGYGENGVISLPSCTKGFVSYWVLIPSGNNYPGEGGEGTNWKIFWWSGDRSLGGRDMTCPIYNGSNWYLSSNDLGNNGSDPLPYININFSKGTWTRLSFWCDSTGKGAIKAYQLRPSSGTSAAVNWTGSSTLSWSESSWTYLFANAYGRSGTSNCHPTYDDIYVAVGDYAQARIEIGNNATYNSCTKLALCTPNSWNSTTISAKVWQGNFTANDHVYLFVTDSTGTISSAYDLGMFGSGSGGGGGGGADTTPPASPSGVTITVIQ